MVLWYVYVSSAAGTSNGTPNWGVESGALSCGGEGVFIMLAVATTRAISCASKRSGSMPSVLCDVINVVTELMVSRAEQIMVYAFSVV